MILAVLRDTKIHLNKKADGVIKWNYDVTTTLL